MDDCSLKIFINYFWLWFYAILFLYHRTSFTESMSTLPPFGPIEGHKWLFQISSQWEAWKNRFAYFSYGKKFSSLLFTVTSTALPWEFYFFKLTQHLTVTVQLLYALKRKEENLIENHTPSLCFKQSVQKPQLSRSFQKTSNEIVRSWIWPLCCGAASREVPLKRPLCTAWSKHIVNQMQN